MDILLEDIELQDIICPYRGKMSDKLAKKKLFSMEKDIARAQLKKVVEWGDLFCVNREHYGISKYVDKRQRECRQCWQAPKKEAQNGY